MIFKFHSSKMGIGIIVSALVSTVVSHLHGSAREWAAKNGVRQEIREYYRKNPPQPLPQPPPKRDPDEEYVKQVVEKVKHVQVSPTLPTPPLLIEAVLLLRWWQHKHANHDRDRLYQILDAPVRRILISGSADQVHQAIQQNPLECMKLESPQILALAIVDAACGPNLVGDDDRLKQMAMTLVDQGIELGKLIESTATSAAYMEASLQWRRYAREQLADELFYLEHAAATTIRRIDGKTANLIQNLLGFYFPNTQDRNSNVERRR
jgi:hypothetical protein